MSSQPPPSYQTATNQVPAQNATRPALNVTDAHGATHRANSADAHNKNQPNLQRMQTNDTVSTAGDYDDGIEDDDRHSMDDEMRDLPKGWVRCFDPKTQHHFYVEKATERATWVHPYDDPEYLSTLPDTHPANPNSAQAQAVHRRAQEEARMTEMKKGLDTKAGDRDDSTTTSPRSGGKHRNWLQRQTDKVVGTPEERAKHKAEKRRIQEEQYKRAREAQQAYLKRREELMKKQLNDPNTRSMYGSNPYQYSAPSGPYSRTLGMSSSPYGYGYGGGYGRRGYGYGGGMGMGMPLMGGLAGGLLLGDMFGGGMGGFGGYGGGCGGGGFGGGGGGCGGGGM